MQFAVYHTEGLQHRPLRSTDEKRAELTATSPQLNLLS